MFMIKVDIYTDDDFGYDNQNIVFQTVNGSFKEALEVMLIRLEEIFNTIHGKDWVVEKFKFDLKYVINNLKETINVSTINSANYYNNYIDLGNQYGEFEVSELSLIRKDNIITYFEKGDNI